ncbi:gag protein [Danaus plexippus plexippus]|uniref:Gag protein n=1 Tax=Danaus plexippus plexippus TaxID=278856 RepID=A0A212EHQ4_DANPL|nr:gag protein [Danaus plexippus plexippus]
MEFCLNPINRNPSNDDTARTTNSDNISNGPDLSGKQATTPAALPPRDSKGLFLTKQPPLQEPKGASQGHTGEDSDLFSRPVTPISGFGPVDDDGSMSVASTVTAAPMKRPSTVLYSESDAENPASAVAPKKPTALRGRSSSTPSSASTRPVSRMDVASASEEEPCPGPSYRNILVGTARSAHTSPQPTLNSLDRQELRSIAGQCAARLLNVTMTSDNLKGPYVRDIKEATQTMSDIVDMLANRTASEELQRLWANNARLENENEHLRTELKALRRDFSERKKSPARERTPATGPTPSVSDMLGELQRTLTLTMGEMINARLAGLEDRLLPAKTVHPPLRADSRKEAEPVAGPSGAAAAAVAKKAPPKKGPGPKKGSAQAQAKKAPAPTKKDSQSAKKAGPSATTSLSSTGMDEAGGETWTTVAQKGKKKKKKKKMPLSGAKQAQQTQPASKAKTAKGHVKLTPPNSSAVTISLTPEATESGVTYQQVLERAQSAINLGELGIGALKFRVTSTGARMFEIPGTQSGPKADLLAEKLREVVGEVARVLRPVKTADIRITGFSDAVTPDRIASTVAEKGGCPPGSFRVGPIRTGPRGLRWVVVVCPVAAAKKLVAEGPLSIGWDSVKVQALGPRPMRCFKCMGTDHTRSTCQSLCDRSDLCHRCGVAGHKAAECSVAIVSGGGAGSPPLVRKELGGATWPLPGEDTPSRLAPLPVLVLGDLNAKSFIWGSTATVPRGTVGRRWRFGGGRYVRYPCCYAPCERLACPRRGDTLGPQLCTVRDLHVPRPDRNSPPPRTSGLSAMSSLSARPPTGRGGCNLPGLVHSLYQGDGPRLGHETPPHRADGSMRRVGASGATPPSEDGGVLVVCVD